MPKPVKNSDVQVGIPGESPVTNGDSDLKSSGPPVSNGQIFAVPVGTSVANNQAVLLTAFAHAPAASAD
jgi:hypothetical protein